MNGRTQRNYGIDTLRVVTTYLIVCLHVLNRGGVLKAADPVTWGWLQPLTLLSSASVDLYALISGYVLLQAPFRPARVGELWLQVFFLNVGIGLVGILVLPGSMDGFWIRYLFPLTQKAFWYFTAYVGVYAFSPILNRGIRSLNRSQARGMTVLLFLLFSLGSLMGYSGQGDPFSIGNGYSVLWLLALYGMGACLRQGGLFARVKTWKLILLALGSLLLLWLESRLLSLPGVSQFWKDQAKQVYSYLNPHLTFMSLCLLRLFSRLRLPGTLVGPVKRIAPLTFGIYVIHVHHVCWTQMEDSFRALGQLPGPLALLAILGMALGIFLACMVVDWLRALMFRVLRVRPCLDRLEAWLLRRWRRLEIESESK